MAGGSAFADKNVGALATQEAAPVPAQCATTLWQAIGLDALKARGAAGSPKEIFQRRCASCHRLDGYLVPPFEIERMKQVPGRLATNHGDVPQEERAGLGDWFTASAATLEKSSCAEARAMGLRGYAGLAAVDARVKAVASRYSELSGLHVGAEVAEYKVDFFRAWPGKAWKSSAGREYLIRFSQARLASARPEIPAEAIDGVIAHELCHAVDYSKLSSVGIAKLAVGYGLSGDESKETVAYEREMDRCAKAHGFGRDLAAYRRWLERVLPPEEVAKKKRIYLWVDELER